MVLTDPPSIVKPDQDSDLFPLFDHGGSLYDEGDAGYSNDIDIQVTLHSATLWQKFAAIGTEMMITKTGRYSDISCDRISRPAKVMMLRIHTYTFQSDVVCMPVTLLFLL